jgi:outer membrane receptor for ferric coprogen and ferric-rhodotorulic acid
MLTLFNISNTLSKGNYQKYDNYEPFGYCCEDCDGDREQYKRSNYEHYVWCNVREDIRKDLNSYFNGIRDESYLKNPMPANLFRMP